MAHYDCSCCGSSMGISHDKCDDCQAGKCHRAQAEEASVQSTNTTPEAKDLAVVGCISEEAGEIMEVLGRIVKVAGKIARHGMVATDTHVTGDGQTYDNRADLETECGQLIGAIRFGVRRGLLNPKRLFAEAEAKLAKLSCIHGDGEADPAPAREFRQELEG